jgi:Na+-driven multidrug efflux pump
MVVGFLCFQLIPEPLFRLFNASDHMLSMGIPALRIISLHFLLAGFCIIIGSVFQALGNGIYSMVVSVTRQIVVLLPAAYLLSLLGNVNYVWWSFPIAELASLLVSTFFLYRIYHKVIKHIGEDIA